MIYVGPATFGYLAAAMEAFAIVAAGLASGEVFRLLTLGLLPPVEPATGASIVVALLVVLSNAQSGGYRIGHFQKPTGHFAHSFSRWNFAFLVALTLGFATKTSSEFSREAIAAFYVLGLVTLTGARLALAELASAARRLGVSTMRRIVVVGFEDSVKEQAERIRAEGEEVAIVSSIALRDDPAWFGDDLALAAAAVRVRRPDDICIAIPWSREEAIETAVDVFLRTPSQVFLGGEKLLARFAEARVAPLGSLNGLSLTRPPLTWLQKLEKRSFDVVVSSLALLALSPFMFVVALFIRLADGGPALFRQTRYGFNQEPFRIFKFRTMRTMENGRTVVQAKKGDPRVTRLGAFLRRSSIDELPQLINVLKGDMSIVGPRPHALAHDQLFVARIAHYARRHNVKPGITGWAQVNGHRGEITDHAALQARLDDDLYYIDNWSLWLDVKIVLMTILSRHAHKNAY